MLGRRAVTIFPSVLAALSVAMAEPAASAPTSTYPELVAHARSAVEARDPTALAQVWFAWSDPRRVLHPAVLDDLLQFSLQSSIPGLADHTRWLQSRRAIERGDLERARELRDGLGIPPDALLTEGDVPLESGGADLLDGRTWLSVPRAPVTGTFRPGGVLGHAEGQRAWLAWVLVSNRPRTVVMRLGARGRLRSATVIGQVGPKSAHAALAPDQDEWGIRVRPGPNLVVVEVQSLSDPSELFVRFGPGATVLPADEARPQVEELWRGNRRPLVRRRSSRRSEPTRQHSVDDAAWFAWLRHERAVDAPEVIPSAAERWAERAAPRSTFAALVLASIVTPRDPDRARDLYLRTLESDPPVPEAWYRLGELSARADRVFDAVEAYDTARRLQPDNPAFEARRAELGFDRLGESSYARERLRRSPARRSPQVAAEAARMALATGDLDDAWAWVEEGLRVDYGHAALRSLAFTIAVERGDEAEALRRARADMALEPDRVRPRLEYARLVARTPSAALRSLEPALALFPTNAELLVTAADLCAAAGDDAAAAKHLEAALRVEPHRRELASWRAELLSETPAAPGVQAKPAWHEREVAPLERAVGAALLFDQRTIQLYPDGSYAREIHQVVRVLEPERHADLQTWSLPYAPSREVLRPIEIRRVSADGRSEPPVASRDVGTPDKVAGMYLDQRFFVLELGRLEAYDIIEVHYRIESHGPNPFGGFFGSVEHAQSELPSYEFIVDAVAPKTRPFFGVQRGLPAPQTISGADTQTLRWRAGPLTALPVEPLGPAYTEVGAFVSFGSYRDWSQLSSWYAAIVRKQLVLDEPSRGAARRAVGSAKGTADIVKKLFDYVVRSTRYVGIELGVHGFTPFPAHEVHQRRYGDCKDKSVLLMAMLQEFGIEARIVLVRTVDRGPFPEDAPTMWSFNHAVTYVPSLDLYLDPTTEFTSTDVLPELDQGAFALVIGVDGSHRLAHLPRSTAADNFNRSRYRATLGSDGTLVLSGRESFGGAPAAEVRRVFQAPESRRRQLELHLGGQFSGVTIESLEFDAVDGRVDPVGYRYDAAIGRYGRRKGDRIVLPVSLFQHGLSGRYAGSASRSLPVRIAYPWKTTNRIEYSVPEAATVEVLPEGVVIDSEWVTLRQSVETSEDGFVVEDTVEFTARRIEPEDYSAFRAVCLRIDDAMNRKVVIRWQ